MIRYRFSSWDGTQEIFPVQPDELLAELADEYMVHGDLWRALRRLMQQGLTTPSGGRMEGIQDLLSRLRSLRQEALDHHNLDSVYRDIQERLKRIVETEREGIHQRLQGDASAPPGPGPDDAQPSPPSPGHEFQQLLQQIAGKNLAVLDRLPTEPAEAIQALRSYEFLDPDARRQFEELLQMLQQAVAESFFRDLSQSIKDLSPQEMDRLRRMVDNINRMIQERRGGGEPDLQSFMEEFGSYFGPTPPATMEDLLAQLQGQMAQMQSLFSSLSPEMRQSLADILNAKLVDPQLQGALAELAANLDALFPQQRGKEYPFQGDDPLTLTEAMRLMERLRQMDDLERQLERTRLGVELDEIDEERLRDLLGEEASRAWEQLKKLTELLEQEGYLRREGKQLQLTPHGMRKIGQKALRDIFERMKKDRYGNHPVEVRGAGFERADETKIYEFGDPFLLHLEKTVMNAMQRGSVGLPLSLEPQDFEVYRTEQLTHSSTALMLDLSRSMPMRGNFVAAKKVALALSNLIRTQFPRDKLYLVCFSGFAQAVKSEELPRVEVGDFGRGTNIQAGLMVSRKLLSQHKGGSRQIIMITDGEPTAYFERDGRVSIEFPPSARVLRATLQEVKRCTTEGIRINTFMLERSSYLREFVKQIARINHGRAFFTSSDRLGQYILVDYVSHKQRRVIA